MTGTCASLYTDYTVLLWLARERWTPRRELGDPRAVETLIARGYAKVWFPGRHGDDGGDGICLTELGWEEVQVIKKKLADIGGAAMTDIVERLRKASVYEYGEATYSPLGDEAADEIEQLRAMVTALEQALASVEKIEVEQ